VILTAYNYILYQSIKQDYRLRQEMLGYVSASPCSLVSPSKAQNEQERPVAYLGIFSRGGGGGPKNSVEDR
jgi:hypothetical protein